MTGIRQQITEGKPSPLRAFSNPMYGIVEFSRMARPSIAGWRRNRPKGHARDRVRRQRHKDVPSVAPGSSRRRAGSARHPGALFFGFFLLGKQKKETRRRGETRFKLTGCRRQLPFEGGN